MSVTDYVIDILLILVIFRQVRRVRGERGPLLAGPIAAEPYVGARSS